MEMDTNENKPGFFKKFQAYMDGYDWGVVPEVRQGTIEPTAGEVSPLSGVIPPPYPSTDAVTPEEAMSIGTVFRAIDIIANSVSQLEVGVYRAGLEIETPSIIKRPDVNSSPNAFYQELTISLALWGNAYIRIYGDVDNPASLKVIDPRVIQPTVNKQGKKVWQVGNETLAEDRIKHLKHTRLPGAEMGIGPIQKGQEEIRAAVMLRKFQNEWFDTRIIPTGIITTDLPLNDEERADLAKAWSEFLKTAGGLGVLGNGGKFQALRLKPAEAQFLEVQAANDKNLARLFGVPVVMMNVEIGGTSFTYMNMEQTINLFYQTTLIRYINEIENALSDLLPRGQRVVFKEEGLLRIDQVTKWNIIEKQVGIGYTSGAELRELEGKAPLPSTAMPEANPVTENKEDEDNGNGNS